MSVCVWTHMMLVEVNMGKASHAQPLLQLPLSTRLVLSERRFLHGWKSICIQTRR